MKTLKNGLDRFLAFVCIVDFYCYGPSYGISGGSTLRV